MSESPRITQIDWGRIAVEGLAAARDMKLWPGGGREWDWRETGTHHVPGIQIADVEELVDHGARIIILSRGMQLALQTCAETFEYLEERALRCRWVETREATKLYNELANQGEPVGGLFHTTC